MCIRDRDRSEAVYRLSALDHSLSAGAGLVTLPGLDPERSYQVSVIGPAVRGSAAPWMRDGVRTSGRLLDQVGVRVPRLLVDELVIIGVQAVS